MPETNFAPRLGEIFEAHSGPVEVFDFNGVPSGAAPEGAFGIDTSNGDFYQVVNGSWVFKFSTGGGVGAVQTPWAQDIQGAGFDLLNVRDITATRHILAEGSLRVRDTSLSADEAREWYFLSEDSGLSLYSLASGVTQKWFSISDPNEGFQLVGAYKIAAAAFEATELHVIGAGVVFDGLAGAGGFLAIDGGGTITKGTPAVLGANTFTALQTITQASANAGILASTGYSLTGSNATSMLDLAGTWNTSGNPVALKLAISNTASGATSKFLSFLAGAAGATEVLSVDKAGMLTFGGTGSTTGLQFQSSSKIYEASGFIFLRGGSGNFIGVTPSASDLGQLSFGAAGDCLLARDAANTLALRNSTNAQRLRIYNSFTTVDTSGEWLKIDWAVTANQCRIGTVMGTSAGTARVLSIDYGALSASPTAAITIPIASGPIVFGGPIKVAGVVVASLPSAATAGDGARAYVTDAVSQVFGATVTGGGAVPSPVYSDGTVWRTG